MFGLIGRHRTPQSLSAVPCALHVRRTPCCGPAYYWSRHPISGPDRWRTSTLSLSVREQQGAYMNGQIRRCHPPQCACARQRGALRATRRVVGLLTIVDDTPFQGPTDGAHQPHH